MSAASILVATPAYNNQVCAAYTNSLLGLGFACRQRGIGFEYAHTTSQSLIPAARNELVRYFLHNTRCSHLLFIDGDMTFKADQVLQMLDTQRAVIAAVCPMKKINWARIKQAVIQNPDIDVNVLAQAGASYKTFATANDTLINIDQPFLVSQIGTGIMLIAREVFSQLLPIAQRDAQGQVHYFESGIGEDGVFLSEDLHFCALLHKAGIPIYAAAWLEIGHIGNYEHVGSLGHLAENGLPI